MEDVADTVSAALGGRPAGLFFKGDRRYQIVVRVPKFQRNDLEALGTLPIMLPEISGSARSHVPLRALANFAFSEGLNEISRDNGKRRTFLEANVRDRDMGSFVDEARSTIARNVRIPPGTWLEWGGQFQNLQRAVRRLELVVPVWRLPGHRRGRLSAAVATPDLQSRTRWLSGRHRRRSAWPCAQIPR
jgi:cobalt-zinc-cadmium resistance protein CzcA